MRIRRLKLSGFKSFVDAAELRVEPGLTGIVGPNGCGKSNLLEAIRWVMGEASAKSMRGGGMDDVIFAGTSSRPARDFAEVSMLAERDGEGAGAGEIEVVRRIERGTGSAYRVDGRDVRARDVALIFADAATGAHSPALVSQGRIGAVIAARPAERRQMLEEAAGIAGLHVRRKDAEQKLRATEANLARLDEFLVEMESRIGLLRRQARAAERYKSLSDAIRTTEGRLIYARWRDASAAAEVAKRDAVAAEASVAAAADAQRGAAAVQASETRKLAEARSAAQAARDAAGDSGHRLAAVRAERDGIERRVAQLSAQVAALARDRAREGALAEDAAMALARLDAEQAMLGERIAGAAGYQAEVAARLATAAGATRDAEVALAQALARQAAEQADLRVAQAARTAAAQRLDRAERTLARLAAEVSAAGDAEPLRAAAATAAAARGAGEREREAATAAIVAAEAARVAATEEREAAQIEAASAQAAQAALEAEARALAAAVAAGEKRGGSGVRAAPGYERALAAALGDDLDVPVGGNGTRAWTGASLAQGVPALPDGAAALLDHVTAPAELHARLAQIGVVDRDDGAIALALGQRLVTRDGRLRRWDGFVASDIGAAAAERLIRINRLAELDAALPKAAGRAASAAGRVADARAALSAADQAIEAARGSLRRAEQAMRGATIDEDRAVAALERLAAQQRDLAERTARAEAERAEAASEAAAATAAGGALPDPALRVSEIAALNRTAADARGGEAQLRAEVATLARGLGADRDRAAAAAAEAASWRTRGAEAKQRIEEMGARALAAESDAQALADAPAAFAAREAALVAESETAAAAARDTLAAERAAEDALRAAEAKLGGAGETFSLARETRAGAVARYENQETRRVEMGRVSGERFECPAVLLPEKAGFVGAEVGETGIESARLERLTADRERIGPVNLIAARELAELEAGRDASMAEREELGQAVHRLRGSIGSLNREGRARLLAAFEAVDRHFRRLFTTLFEGGQAHLALVDADDPLEAGLEIMAQPPGKKLASLTLLSGGEQALTAIALIFALFLTNPAPICVLDEVDAPLDDANIERFCDLLDRMTQETETRYLIVTHNAVTMSRMHRLFGVTMIERGVSRLVSVDLGGAERLLAAE